MGCAKDSDIDDCLAGTLVAEEHRCAEEYNVVLSADPTDPRFQGDDGERSFCHSYELHGPQHTWESLHNLHLDTDRPKNTAFSSYEFHMAARDQFLSTHKDAMDASLARGEQVFIRDIDCGRSIGFGYAGDASHEAIEWARFFYANVDGQWYEITGFPKALVDERSARI